MGSVGGLAVSMLVSYSAGVSSHPTEIYNGFLQ